MTAIGGALGGWAMPLSPELHFARGLSGRRESRTRLRAQGGIPANERAPRRGVGHGRGGIPAGGHARGDSVGRPSGARLEKVVSFGDSAVIWRKLANSKSLAIARV